MRMRGIINIVGVIAVIQGVAGFVGRMWFDSEWGFLHRLVDLPRRPTWAWPRPGWWR